MKDILFNKLPNEIKKHIILFLVDNCYECDKNEFYIDENLIRCSKCEKKFCKYHLNKKINSNYCNECCLIEYSELKEGIEEMFSFCRQC